MVDREARDRLAEALRRFAGRQLSTEEFLAALDLSRRDRGVASVRRRALSLFEIAAEEGLVEKPLLTPRERGEIATWIIFLRTDLDSWGWPLCKSVLVLALYTFVVLVTMFACAFLSDIPGANAKLLEAVMIWALLSDVVLLVVLLTVWTWPLGLVLALTAPVFLALREFSLLAAVVASAAAALAAVLLVVRRRPRGPELVGIWPFTERNHYEAALRDPRNGLEATEIAAAYVYTREDGHSAELDRIPTREEKRQVARWVLFLQTDHTHIRSKEPRSATGCLAVSACIAGMLAVVIYLGRLVPESGALFTILTGFRSLCSVLLGLAVIGTLVDLFYARRHRRWRRQYQAAGYDDIWPFSSVEDYESALSQPKFLTGGAEPKDSA